jgi:tRNA-dihydrouridine synthase
MSNSSNICNNFWLALRDSKKPISILAPMEDVTDSVFRRVILKAGSPSLFFTEFTNCDGICSVGKAKVIHRLYYTKLEIENTPLVAQIWGKTPQNYYETAKLCLEMGFSGIDINMGCPEKNVIKIGACSALINNHELAKEIVDAVQKGVGGKIPVSIKTRIGFNEVQVQDWIGFLARQNIQAITVHGRTVKEMSEVPNHFDEIKKASQIVKQTNPNIVFIANGDIIDFRQGEDLCFKNSEIDGYMVGRGVFKNPWCFNKEIELVESTDGQTKIPKVTKIDRVGLLNYHLDLWQETWTPPQSSKHYPTLKKYFKIYINNFEGANELRAKLMDTKNISEVREILKDIK